MDHPVVHFEIPANDVEKLKRFYEDVFVGRLFKTPGPMEYWIIQTVRLTQTAYLLNPE